MGIKCRIIKPLNKLVRRGEEDSSFCCMLTQYILFWLSSSVCFQYIFLWTSDHFFNGGLLIAPSPSLYSWQALYQTELLKDSWCFVFAVESLLCLCTYAVMTWGDFVSLYVTSCASCVTPCTECDVRRTSRSVLFCHVHSFPFLCVFVALPLSFAVML